MRLQQQNRRVRGRNNLNRKGSNSFSRNYESNGPDIKIRGSAQQIAEKYTVLARDAQSAGDRVMSESYLQHAEHYNRIIAAAQSQSLQESRSNPETQEDQNNSDEGEILESSDLVSEDLVSSSFDSSSCFEEGTQSESSPPKSFRNPRYNGRDTRGVRSRNSEDNKREANSSSQLTKNNSIDSSLPSDGALPSFITENSDSSVENSAKTSPNGSRRVNRLRGGRKKVIPEKDDSSSE